MELPSFFSGGNRFPQEMSNIRTLYIKVYETTDADMVFNGLIQGTKQAINKQKSFFDTSGGSPTPQMPKDVGNPRLAQKFVTMFELPLPNSLSEALSNQYSEENGWFNDMMGGAAQVANNIKLPGVGGVGDAGKSVVSGAEKLSAIYAKATGARRIKFYENKIQMYNGTNFREITLTWNLVPKNEAEAKAIQNIIKSIKIYGSPDTMAGKLLLKDPHFFKLDFKNPIINDALRFDEVVLINLSVDYSSSGNMELYCDGMPKSVNVTMSFRDRMPKVQSDWLSEQDETQSANEQNCNKG